MDSMQSIMVDEVTPEINDILAAGYANATTPLSVRSWQLPCCRLVLAGREAEAGRRLSSKLSMLRRSF